MLRGLYDLLFVDAAVEGRFMDYVAARIEGVVLRGRFAKYRTRTRGKMVIKNRIGVFEIDFSNDTLGKTVYAAVDGVDELRRLPTTLRFDPPAPC